MYLYDNMDTTTKFNETELPPKEEFYSKLNDSDISHEDYKNAKKGLERVQNEDDG